MSLRRLPLLAAVACVVLAAACSSEKTATAPPLPPPIPCNAAEVSGAMDPANNVHVFVDDALPQQVRDDVGAYLGRMWKTNVAVQVGSPAGQAGDAIWISSAADAKTAARHATDAANSYSLARADDGGRKVLVAYAATTADLVSATYALLEELGVRFFHPMQELVPELGSPFFPRGLDAHRLPPLDGHVTFSSGHEWNYWMHDYLTAKMLWEPGANLDRFLGLYGSAYGSCGAKITDDLTQFIGLERQYLFEKKRVAYVSGEDNAVDLGALTGHVIRELRKKFDDLVTGSEADRAAFESSVLADLDAFTKAVRPIEDDVDARCRGSDATLAPWCNEMRDGMRVLRLRLEQQSLVYRAVLAYARGDKKGAASAFAAAKAKVDEATPVIQGRAKSYRFDAGRLTNGYLNSTNYAFGYLRQAHTQCFWKREIEQARRIIEEDIIGGLPTGLPGCLD